MSLPTASSVTHIQWPMSTFLEAASCAQVCMTRARVYALWSRTRSTSVSSRCAFDRSRAALPVCEQNYSARSDATLGLQMLNALQARTARINTNFVEIKAVAGFCRCIASFMACENL